MILQLFQSLEKILYVPLNWPYIIGLPSTPSTLVEEGLGSTGVARGVAARGVAARGMLLSLVVWRPDDGVVVVGKYVKWSSEVFGRKLSITVVELDESFESLGKAFVVVVGIGSEVCSTDKRKEKKRKKRDSSDRERCGEGM